jgi:biotin/lipoyl-binding protein
MLEPAQTLDEVVYERIRLRRRKPWPMFVAAALFVIVAFLSWYGSWFGRPLTDAQITEYLNDNEKPRHIQHALDQIVGRMDSRDKSVRQWYSKIISLARHPVPQVREWAAVTMGHDNGSEEFHASLRSMLGDEDRIVRSSAALWLVRFNDASGRSQLVEMLKPVTMSADCAGVVALIADREGVAVSREAPMLRIRQPDSGVVELRPPFDGRIETLLISDGATVEAGTPLVVLSPGVKNVENALIALHWVGESEDLRYIEHYTQDLPGMPEHIRQKAMSAITAIRDRTSRR